ncbi:MAG: tryptophan synthase subunit alpha, partial [Blastocatellia bacterium]|nr:tryptophan synthase subunit alpha [Blastocatellia bacterium]
GIRDILELDGYSVLTAENGNHGLEVLQNQSSPPDLIVSDIMMPKMDGIQFLKEVRKETDVPIILFSYFNPLLQYGLENLCADAKNVGVDGFLVTDLVPEEAGEFSNLLKKNDLDMIFLVAPTSGDERLKMVAERASGFIYAVSRTGVTGAQETTSQSAEVLVNRMKQFSDLPIAVGFGISTAEQITKTWKYADAAVVGSAIVREIEKFGGDENLVERIEEFTTKLLPKI